MRVRRYGTAVAVTVMVVGGCGLVGGCDGSGGGGSGASAAGPGRPWGPRPSHPPTSTHRPHSSRPPTSAVVPTSSVPTSSVPSAPVPSGPAELSACYDGTCEISVPAPTTIPVDAGRFGFSRFRIVRIGPDGVTIEAASEGTYLQSTVSTGGTAALNGLAVHVDSVHADRAHLSLTPNP